MFEKLFQPININGLTLKNRIVMSAMGTVFATFDGRPTPRMIDYFVERSKGGVGLIIVEATAVEPRGVIFPHETAILDDSYIENYKELTAAVHSVGGKIAMQLAHGGRQTKSILIGTDTVAPSPIPAPSLSTDIPRELSLNEIDEIIEYFTDAAERVSKAGFDAIELHGAHGYLISNFLAPNANVRTDQYGGSPEKRALFLCRVVSSIRERLGPDFPISCRINGEDYIQGGLTLEDAKKMAPLFVEAGASVIHVSAGVYGSYPATIPPMGTEPGCFVPLAEGIKSVVNVPVIAAGRIKTPELAENILRDGKADMVTMGRAIIIDPEMPDKARRGDVDKIRTCIGCNQGCIERMLRIAVTMKIESITCLLNPRVGREKELIVEPSVESRRVVVIGGGPGGMQAGVIASDRGHEVILIEKKPRLGGNMNLAAITPTREEFVEGVAYLISEIDRSNVEVRLNTCADIEMIREFAPDAVIIASGSSPVLPDIPGVDGRVVMTYQDALTNVDEVGGNVLIIGSNQVGLETADFLAQRGRSVHVVESGEHFAEDLGQITRFYLRTRLNEWGVILEKRARVTAIGEDYVMLNRNGETGELKGLDTVITTINSPNSWNIDVLKDFVRDVYVIGDALEPRKSLEAIAEGFEAGCRV